jgi:serine phosphatase RsbU (regulator of sigma subunit)
MTSTEFNPRPNAQQELRQLASALADSYDTIVFLEEAVQQLLGCEQLQDILPVLHEACRIVGARSAGLYLDGAWLTPMPPWLRSLPTPITATRRHGGQPVLMVPFEGGWSVFWDRADDFQSSDERIALTFGRLVSNTRAAIQARAERFKSAQTELETNLATQLWRSVMLDRQTQLPGYRWRAWYETARGIGGDFYLIAQRWVLLGDIGGKGLRAALFACMFDAAARVAVHEADVAASLERALLDDLQRSDMSCTLFGARLEENGWLRYFNLGHPSAYIYRVETGRIEALTTTALPLGGVKQERFITHSVEMRPGDLLLCYTDGLTGAHRATGVPAMAGSPAGTERFGSARLEILLSAARNPEQLLSSIRGALQSWTVDDDICIVALQRDPEEATP